jgi:hypothetical protein
VGFKGCVGFLQGFFSWFLYLPYIFNSTVVVLFFQPYLCYLGLCSFFFFVLFCFVLCLYAFCLGCPFFSKKLKGFRCMFCVFPFRDMV